jgi:hypothetical protein
MKLLYCLWLVYIIFILTSVKYIQSFLSYNNYIHIKSKYDYTKKIEAGRSLIFG